MAINNSTIINHGLGTINHLRIPPRAYNLQGVNLTQLRYCPPGGKPPRKTFSQIVCSAYKALADMSKQMRVNMQAFGVSNWDNIFTNILHGAPVMPATALFVKIKSQTVLGNVNLMQRHSSKQINAQLEKLDFGDETIVYVLKNKKRQLGVLEAEKHDRNKNVYINYMTNLLGRKKYRNIENVLLQGMVEDCVQSGYVPKICATPANVASSMGRGYNNDALYKRMGMQRISLDDMSIEPDKVKEIISKRIIRNGEIISGSKELLKNL